MAFRVLIRHLEDHLELYRDPQRQRCHPEHDSCRRPAFTKDVAEELGCAIRYLRMICELIGRHERYAEAYDLCHSIERTQVLSGNRDRIDGSEPSGLSPFFRRHSSPDRAGVPWLPVLDRQDSTQEQKISRLNGLDIRAQR